MILENYFQFCSVWLWYCGYIARCLYAKAFRDEMPWGIYFEMNSDAHTNTQNWNKYGKILTDVEFRLLKYSL